jgi:hypothetical protein
MCHAWTRKSINAHRRAPHLKYIMLCILFFFFFVFATCMRSQQRIRGLMQLHVKGSRHHKLPTLFLFPHRVYKCIFPLSPLSSKLLFIQTPSAHTQPKIYVLLLYYNTCLWLRDKLFFSFCFPLFVILCVVVVVDIFMMRAASITISSTEFGHRLFAS